ncbi:hypothetical protein EJ08DRAFT_248409 [Tothia fuscella]|uniref:Uncharacterized protein n=1 Tax=Tothia fuscella TaxID=1048955 RepID=A0A9P4NQN8_9PEZI|nr:hypothetical protein EJ08DRAFT_248409 [Tothia fuscella]
MQNCDFTDNSRACIQSTIEGLVAGKYDSSGDEEKLKHLVMKQQDGKPLYYITVDRFLEIVADKDPDLAGFLGQRAEGNRVGWFACCKKLRDINPEEVGVPTEIGYRDFTLGPPEWEAEKLDGLGFQPCVASFWKSFNGDLTPEATADLHAGRYNERPSPPKADQLLETMFEKDSDAAMKLRSKVQ